MKLLFVLHNGPDSNDCKTVITLSKAARTKGHEVTVFAMSSGVFNLGSSQFTALLDDGVSIAVCEHNRKDLHAPAGIEGVHYGSQFDLALYVADADKVVGFTG